MYVSDIQEEKDGKIKISFADEGTNENCLDIVVEQSCVGYIKDFWLRNLSYGAKKKK